MTTDAWAFIGVILLFSVQIVLYVTLRSELRQKLSEKEGLEFIDKALDRGLQATQAQFRLLQSDWISQNESMQRIAGRMDKNVGLLRKKEKEKEEIPPMDPNAKAAAEAGDDGGVVGAPPGGARSRVSPDELRDWEGRLSGG